MIKNKIMFVFLLSFILFLVIPVSGQGRRWMTQPNDYIDLTSDQLAKIQELELTFQKDILPLRTKLMTGYTELDNMYVQYADQKKIENKLNELDRMESELDKKFTVYQQQIRRLLTDEQKIMFDRNGGLGMGADQFGGLDTGYGRGMMGMRYNQAGSLGTGYGRGMGMRYNQAGSLGMGYGRGMGMRSGQAGSLGMGYGRGMGMRSGQAGSLGMGYGRGMGMRSGRAGGLGMGYGRGMGMRSGRAGGLGMGYTRGVGINSGFGRNLGRGMDRASGWNRNTGYGRSLGRGFRCPYFLGWRFR